jgi:hypothetical protein
MQAGDEGSQTYNLIAISMPLWILVPSYLVACHLGLKPAIISALGCSALLALIVGQGGVWPFDHLIAAGVALLVLVISAPGIYLGHRRRRKINPQG